MYIKRTGYCDFKGVVVHGEVADRFDVVVKNTSYGLTLPVKQPCLNHRQDNLQKAVRVSRCTLSGAMGGTDAAISLFRERITINFQNSI